MGTSEGAKKALEKILAANPNHFREIGKIGGQLSKTGGYASGKVGDDGLTGKERAKLSGAKGGTISRRGPAVYVSYKGERVTLSHLAKAEGISYRTAHAQMTAGKYEKI